MKKIFLDTETTGLSAEKHRIIEIGAVAYENRRRGENFHRYLNPQQKMEEGAQEVHGLSDEFLADKPLFAAVADDFLDFIRGAEVIIHNAKFDQGFINSELARLKKTPLEETVQTVTCSLEWSRANNHEVRRHSLDGLCEHYGVDKSEREKHHSALLDAQLLAEVYFRMIQRQREMTIPTAAPTIQYSGGDVLVVRASAEEERAHEQFLRDMEQNEKVTPLFPRRND